MKSPGSKTLSALSGLRAIMSAMIFFYHWFFHYAEPLPLLFRAPFEVGYVGVPVFFALSGFLLVVRYAPVIEQDKFSWKQYLFKRFARIYPLYVVVLTLFVIAFGRPENMMPQDAKGFIVAYTLTQAVYPGLLHIGTTVGWTLTVQCLFYLIAPPLMRWFGKMRLDLLVLSALGIGLGAVFLGMLVARIPAPPWLADTLLGASQDYLFHYSLFGHLGDFLAGMVAGFAMQRSCSRDWLARHVHLAIWGGMLGALGCILALDVLKTELGSPLDRLLAFGVALFISFGISGLASDSRRINPITWLLSTRLAVYLGAISYALFLIQLTEPCQWLYWIFLGEWGGIENRILRAVLLYGLSTLFAIGLYHGVERPVQKLLRKVT